MHWYDTQSSAAHEGTLVSLVSAGFLQYGLHVSNTHTTYMPHTQYIHTYLPLVVSVWRAGATEGVVLGGRYGGGKGGHGGGLRVDAGVSVPAAWNHRTAAVEGGANNVTRPIQRGCDVM